MTADTWTLTARWIFPVDRPPLAGGTVTIAGEHIVAVEPGGSRTADVDFGNAAILPGFVNAHTHLDLTGLRGKCPPTDPDHFTDWLRRIIAYRRSRTPEQTQADIREGLAESLRHGTTLIGDIATEGQSWNVLAEAPIWAVVFRELIGLPEERAAAALEAASAWVQSVSDTPTCRKGLSPHAPYSVRSTLYLAATRLVNSRIAFHFAETTGELELLRSRTGPFVGFLQGAGVYDPSGLASDPTWFLSRSPRTSHVIFAHCNYMPPEWCRELASPHTIAYCPRTHAAFGHPPHPFREFLRRGVRVALGTDSLASNPDLSVLAEARFIHGRHADVPGETLLRMATLSGAEALGLADVTGSLSPGKSADLVVLPLPDEESPEPHALVLQSSLPVQAVLCRGRWVHGPNGASSRSAP